MTTIIRLPPSWVLGGSPMALALVEIEMLWPSIANAPKRELARASLFRDFAKPALAGDFLPDKLTRMLAARDSVPPHSLRAEIAAGLHIQHGTIAGTILQRALSRKNPPSMEDAFSFAANELKANGTFGKARFGGHKKHPVTGNRIRIQRKLIVERVWPEFRPVAHLWAATLVLMEKGGRFPCRPEQFVELLALSEAYRKAGEAARLPRRADAILKPGEMVRLPADVEGLLPDVPLPDYEPRLIP